MKLAIIRQRYTPYGGAERFVERALRALVEQGVEVTLITRSWEGASQSGFRQVTIDTAQAWLFGGRTARDRQFAAGAIDEIAKGGYDIVQSHERIPGCTLYRAGDGVHAAWLRHRMPLLSRMERLAQRISPYHRYVLAAEESMYSSPALKMVICNSRMVADELLEFYGIAEDKIAIVQNGIDTDVFHPRLRDEHFESMRRFFGVPDGAQVLLHVGSGFERKGVPQLLRAFSLLNQRNSRLLIVGGDRKLAAMQRLAARLGVADKVVFTGPVKDVRPYYGMADGFVLPSLYDPCPNAILEAMSCGLPVVTSSTCGARDWIKEGVNGVVVGALDVDGLAKALTRLCELSRLDSARMAAREAVEGLTLTAMSNRLLCLYGSLGVIRGVDALC